MPGNVAIASPSLRLAPHRSVSRLPRSRRHVCVKIVSASEIRGRLEKFENMSKVYREKLIDEVKKYPVLYDTRHENHRDIDVRDRCWAEISERLGENSEILKREWKILRDSLRQSLKKCKQGVTTKAGTPCKKWRFQNRMAFVLPYMTIRRQQRRTKDLKIDVADKDIQSDQESEPWEACGDQDSLELFFASVCQSAKRLPKTYQNQLKRQVLDALLRAEEEADGQESKTGVYRSF